MLKHVFNFFGFFGFSDFLDFLDGGLPNRGAGGVFSNPKTFVNLPSVFLYAKIILRCQNMFYNSGEVISDQFHHITLDSKSGKF